MDSRRTVSFLFFLSALLTMPLALARSVILGDFYYPKGGTAWVSRNGKIEFQKGDTIIVMDSRVILGRGTVPGDLPYQLNDKDIAIDKGTPKLNPAEFVVATVTGGNPGANQVPDTWALIVPITVNSGSIGANFIYYDPDSRGAGGAPLIFEEVNVSGLATIIPSSGTDPGPGTGSTLSVTSSTEIVLSNSTFTLTGNLDAVSYTFEQPTTAFLTGKATVPNPPPAGVTINATTGAVTVTGGRSVTFQAPGVATGLVQGTLTFNIQATLTGVFKTNTVTKTITVLKAASPPPVGGTAGTPVGTPQGNNLRADAYFEADNPSQATVSTPFALAAYGRDQDGTTRPADPTIGGSSSCTCITGKWERVVGSSTQVLNETQVADAITAYRPFPIQITESVTGTYTYRFTIVDALGIGNYYQTTVNVTVANPGPAIHFAPEPPASAEAESILTLDASTTTGKGTLQFTWTVKLDGNDVTFTSPAAGKITFKIPLAAAGKKVAVTLVVKDGENKQSTRAFDINVPALQFKALTLPQIRSIANPSAKTGSGTDDSYATQGPDFINYIAIMNPTGEPGKNDLLSVRSVDSAGNPVSDFYRSLEIGLGGVPFARAVEKMVPEEALGESTAVTINSLSRLAGMGMVIDVNLPRMDAFDLASKTGTDWVLPYFFDPRTPRETFGIVALQNAASEDVEVQPSYYGQIPTGSLRLEGPRFILKAGGTRIIELINFFDLSRSLNNLPGYVGFTSTKPIQVLGMYGDNSEMFSVPGVRREDFAYTLMAPLAFRDNEWESVISVVSGQLSSDRVVKVQLLNASPTFPSSLRGKEYSWTLKPGINAMTLGQMFGNVAIPFTALKFSGDAVGNGFAGSVLLRNSATNAETLWTLVENPTSRLIYPHVVQGPDWQAAFAVTNVGSGEAALKASGVLTVRGTGNTLTKKSVQGTFTLPAGVTLAGGELPKLGISGVGEVFGGYLLIEAVDPLARVDLIAGGLMFHNSGKGSIDALSVVPVVK